jgi:hypothetical protein
MFPSRVVSHGSASLGRLESVKVSHKFALAGDDFSPMSALDAVL